MEKVLGLDIGARRVGVAISDELGLLAHPLTTIPWEGRKKFLTTLRNIIAEQAVKRIVIGVPYTLDGRLSRKTREVLNLVRFLRHHLEQPVEEVDESLSTVRAQQALHAVGKKPSKQRKKIDQIAAVFILQDYLDAWRKS